MAPLLVRVTPMHPPMLATTPASFHYHKHGRTQLARTAGVGVRTTMPS